jgi:hypothetical protein
MNTLPRETRSVPQDKLRSLRDSLQAQADNAYIAYLALCKKDAALGWEIKVVRRSFGLAEISAHKAVAEMLGRHQALQEVANRVDQLLKEAAE